MRSPLLQLLIREAKQSHPSITRRQLLKRGAALSALALIPQFFKNQVGAFAETAPNVVIVGAGLAGLTAAYRLKQAGITATIYEAQNRIGGRCWTNRNQFFTSEQYYENAGEFIDSHHLDILALAKELNLQLENYLTVFPKNSSTTYHIQNQNWTDADIKKDFQRLVPTIQKQANLYPVTYKSKSDLAKKLDHMNIAEWIEEYVEGGLQSRLGGVLKAAYEIEFGASIQEQSALNLVFVLGFADTEAQDFQVFGESDEMYHIKGGNDQLVSGMMKQLSGQVKLNYWLTSIEQSKTDVTLSFSNGETVKADYVILTVPFSVLREKVNYKTAGFQPEKVEAIEKLGMGNNSKLVLQFNERTWLKEGGNGNFFTDIPLIQGGWEASRRQEGKEGLLMVFKGAESSVKLSTQRASVAGKEHVDALEKVFPTISQHWNGRATINYFEYYPWVRGSYAYYKPGQYTTFAGIEKEREGNILFAGEHTSMEYQGFMNGAVSSGNRTAKELLQLMKKS